MDLRVDHERWRAGLDALIDTISPRFARCEAARNAGAFILSVLSALETKNCWTMAEMSGHTSPDKLQHLLSRAKWDADDVREDVQRVVLDGLGSERAVLVVDETGDLKKGTRTVGVQRQYTGTAGRSRLTPVGLKPLPQVVHADRGTSMALKTLMSVPAGRARERSGCRRGRRAPDTRSVLPRWFHHSGSTTLKPVCGEREDQAACREDTCRRTGRSRDR